LGPKFFPVFLGIVVAIAVVSFTVNLKESPPSVAPAAMQSAKTLRSEITMVKPEGPNEVTIYVPLIVALFTALFVHKTTSRIMNKESRQEYSQ
jgi:hypothetical protein